MESQAYQHMTDKQRELEAEFVKKAPKFKLLNAYEHVNKLNAQHQLIYKNALTHIRSENEHLYREFQTDPAYQKLRLELGIKTKKPAPHSDENRRQELEKVFKTQTKGLILHDLATTSTGPHFQILRQRALDAMTWIRKHEPDLYEEFTTPYYRELRKSLGLPK